VKLNVLAWILALAALVPAMASAQFDYSAPPTAGVQFPGQSNILLERSGPIRAEYNGQVIENLWVEAAGLEPAVDVTNFDGVVIRNLVVRHSVGPGIRVAGSANVLIENVRVINAAAPLRGPNTGYQAENRVNILGYKASNLQVTKAYLEKGASGIYLLESDRAVLTQIQGFDFRGPFPRGQLVQFDKCINPVLDTFSVVNPGSTAWTEDAVNSYGSVNPVIRNGYIEGVNSPSGVGVLIENDVGGSGGLVENVDVRFWVNGAFSAASRSRDVTFRNVRAYDGLAIAAISDSAGKRAFDGSLLPTLEQWAGPNFRGVPLSGQEAFFAYNASSPASVNYERAGYYNLPRLQRIAWDQKLIRVGDFYLTREGPQPAFKLP
jgi:hypothetical protein